jgi:hypothetical protein
MGVIGKTDRVDARMLIELGNSLASADLGKSSGRALSPDASTSNRLI